MSASRCWLWPGLIWHGLAAKTFGRIGQNLVDRPSRQMAFLFILWPTMATIFAISHGLKDARNDLTPYFWTIASVPEERAPWLGEELKAAAGIILIALVIDTI